VGSSAQQHLANLREADCARYENCESPNGWGASDDGRGGRPALGNGGQRVAHAYEGSAAGAPPGDRPAAGTLAGVSSIDSAREGVLAFGDSITHGGGPLQRDIASQSWAQWTARGLGLPFTSYAVDGARLDEVAAEQLTAWRLRSARPGARYDLGCLYAGVNDVRTPGWDAAAFGARYRQVLGVLAERCDRVLALTLPHDLGRPRAARTVEEANREIEAAAGGLGALVVDLRDLGGPEHVAADHIHPTAFGQIEIAERALDVLERAGADVKVRPSELIIPKARTPVRVAGARARYAGASARVLAKAAAARMLRRR
jgi:lysophospholipase L1-like esterase